MPELPLIKGRKLVKFLESIDFRVTRTKDSHVRLKSEDGRIITVPVHESKDISGGLLRKIIGEDLKISLEEFSELYAIGFMTQDKKI
jgi:predicted RNA binding protein YcfA (HicA-like mRNA interferase family)